MDEGLRYRVTAVAIVLSCTFAALTLGVVRAFAESPAAPAAAAPPAGRGPGPDARLGPIDRGSHAVGSLHGALLSGSQPLRDVQQDVGLSVPLPDGRNLWVFADTFHLHGDPSFFVTSSAAVADRGSVRLTYVRDARGLPVEFLPRTAAERSNEQAGKHYVAVWPTGATVLPDQRVLISYAKYDVVLHPLKFTLLAAGLFVYRYPGLAGLARGAPAERVANDLWTPVDGAIGSPVYADGQLYFTVCQDLKCYSARTTPDRMTDRASYQWWTGSGWSGDWLSRQPMDFGPDRDRPGTTPSVIHLTSPDVYVMGDMLAGSVGYRARAWVAPNPWGPWSDPVSLPLPGCPDDGCYSINLHAEGSSDSWLRVSYATKSGPRVLVSDVSVRVSGSGPSIRRR
jgi:hypothetical protein